VSRYFFHLTNGTMVGDMVEDVDGESFDLVAEARAHAVRVAQELAQHSSLGGRSVSVVDESGVVVFRTPVSHRD
jgi:Domain of unknown function (DUF6894)